MITTLIYIAVLCIGGYGVIFSIYCIDKIKAELDDCRSKYNKAISMYEIVRRGLVSDRIGLNGYAARVHDRSIHWWIDLTKPCTSCSIDVHGHYLKDCPKCYGEGFLPLDRNIGELIALIHSELSEALEGHRKDLMDDHLPQRKMVEVELVDALIRIFDFAGAKGYDLEGAFREKMDYNARREDHKIENRLAENGKKY